MSYVHFWHRPPVLNARLFRRVVRDAQVIAQALHEYGVPLAGPHGDGEPILTQGHIRFNGVLFCDHPVRTPIALSWPAPDASGVAWPGENPIRGTWMGATILGSRCCDGSCNDEPFVLERVLVPDEDSNWEEGLVTAHCRTSFRPYDWAVTCVLLSLKFHFGDAVRVYSHGSDQHWADAKMLCFARLGYGFEYEVGAHDELLHRFDSLADSLINAQVNQPPPRGYEGEVES